MGETARFRYRTLEVEGVQKQRLKRVFKAEPDLHIHETAIKYISSDPEVNTKYELSSKKAKLGLQYSPKHEVMGEIRCNRHIGTY